ncbi:MAG: type II toxin-antitoxin system RelE/ParE family toxin [Rhodospirillaceae bacterium]|nr:type II toxin-antitoxin system RelE/ParE family toxin [Rhodospirillaceae bacterium]
MKRVELSEPAWDDLRAIGDYTRTTWGEKQRRVYLDAIGDTFKALALMPKLGHSRDDLAPGVKSILSGRHVILYEEKPDVIEILHIYHSSEDIEGKFSD